MAKTFVAGQAAGRRAVYARLVGLGRERLAGALAAFFGDDDELPGKDGAQSAIVDAARRRAIDETWLHCSEMFAMNVDNDDEQKRAILDRLRAADT